MNAENEILTLKGQKEHLENLHKEKKYVEFNYPKIGKVKFNWIESLFFMTLRAKKMLPIGWSSTRWSHSITRWQKKKKCGLD